MNKLERRLKGKFKFKKRLANFIFNVDGGITTGSFHALKSTGTPCSCAMCQPRKVEDKAKYRLNKYTKKRIFEEVVESNT